MIFLLTNRKNTAICYSSRTNVTKILDDQQYGKECQLVIERDRKRETDIHTDRHTQSEEDRKRDTVRERHHISYTFE